MFSGLFDQEKRNASIPALTGFITHHFVSLQDGMKSVEYFSIQKVFFFVLFSVSVIFSSNASAQLMRSFPTDSKLGKLKAFAYPEVKIDKQALHLGAGSQIRDENNLIILPATMNKKGPVRYQMDTMGNVHRIWFLTPDEAKQERKKEKK